MTREASLGILVGFFSFLAFWLGCLFVCLFVSFRVVNGLSRKTVETAALKILKNRLNKILGKPTLLGIAWIGALDSMTFRRPLIL